MMANVLVIAVCAYIVGKMCGKSTAERDIMDKLENAAKDGKTIQEFIDEVKSADESEAGDDEEGGEG